MSGAVNLMRIVTSGAWVSDGALTGEPNPRSESFFMFNLHCKVFEYVVLVRKRQESSLAVCKSYIGRTRSGGASLFLLLHFGHLWRRATDSFQEDCRSFSAPHANSAVAVREASFSDSQLPDCRRAVASEGSRFIYFHSQPSGSKSNSAISKRKLAPRWREVMSLDYNETAPDRVDADDFDLGLTEQNFRAIEDDMYNIPMESLGDPRYTPDRSSPPRSHIPPGQLLPQFAREMPLDLDIDTVIQDAAIPPCPLQGTHFSTDGNKTASYVAPQSTQPNGIASASLLALPGLERVASCQPLAEVRHAEQQQNGSHAFTTNPISAATLDFHFPNQQELGLVEHGHLPLVPSDSIVSCEPASLEALTGAKSHAPANVAENLIPSLSQAASRASPEWPVFDGPQAPVLCNADSVSALDQLLKAFLWTDNGGTPPSKLFPLMKVPPIVKAAAVENIESRMDQSIQMPQDFEIPQRKGRRTVPLIQQEKTSRKRPIPRDPKQPKRGTPAKEKRYDVKRTYLICNGGASTSTARGQGQPKQDMRFAGSAYEQSLYLLQGQQRLRSLQKQAASNASASKYCHVCTRSANAVEMAYCKNIARGTCRKIICCKCALEFQWPDVTSAINDRAIAAQWECVHCRNVCPPKAQCNTYGRINLQRRERGKRKREEKAAAAAAARAAEANAKNAATPAASTTVADGEAPQSKRRKASLFPRATEGPVSSSKYCFKTVEGPSQTVNEKIANLKACVTGAQGSLNPLLPALPAKVLGDSMPPGEAYRMHRGPDLTQGRNLHGTDFLFDDLIAFDFPQKFGG
jgi:hypothetical protein